MIMDQKIITHAYRNHVTIAIYFCLRFIVAAAIALYIYEGKFSLAFATLLVFLLMLLPNLLRRRYRLYLPFTLEFGMVLFIFLTFFLGQIQDYYDAVPHWDK